MVSSILISLYCSISILGGIIYYIHHTKKMNQNQKITLFFFLWSHVFLFLVGIFHSLYTIHYSLYILVAGIVIFSRVRNGAVLFQKNNWRHHVVTFFILTIIIILSLNDY